MDDPPVAGEHSTPDDTRPAVSWVVLDVGETIVDETRMWHEWADILGVPRFTLAASLGAVIARGEHHSRVFELVAPGIARQAAREARPGTPIPMRVEAGDLYPDAIVAIDGLRRAGFRVGVAGNQPTATEAALQSIGLDLDLVASSEGWGATKPERAFFERLVEMAGVPASEVAYVGDRLDNDVWPSLAAGLLPVFLRRGPWGRIQETMGPLPAEAIVIDGLAELVERLRPLASTPAPLATASSRRAGGRA
jgi:FMN phosphatase YigB (HAD superfamily)